MSARSRTSERNSFTTALRHALCTSGSCTDSGCTSFVASCCSSHRLPNNSPCQETSSTGGSWRSSPSEVPRAVRGGHAMTIITRKDMHCGHSPGTQRHLGTAVEVLCEGCSRSQEVEVSAMALAAPAMALGVLVLEESALVPAHHQCTT